jgi:gentisate 1,2-dioxygenase
MSPGDFIVTPSWAWHEHRNESREPTIWLDVLDVALMRLLGSGFSEHYAEPEYPQTPASDGGLRDGRGLKPVGDRRGARASPVFAYPFDAAYESLDQERRQGDCDACHGIRMQYIDPTTGGPAIPTLSTFLQLLPQSFTTAPYRATASSVVTVVRGRGRVTIGEGSGAPTFDYAPKDVWAVPSWTAASSACGANNATFDERAEHDSTVRAAAGERRGVRGRRLGDGSSRRG